MTELVNVMTEPVNEMIELVSGMPAPQFGDEYS
jgi:hypothetical protein